MLCLWFFFFKQKTADEMRISDWSSDVCSSDLWSNNTIIECIAASAFRIAGKLGCRAYARQILRVDELGKLIFGDRRMRRQTIDLQQLGRADNLACAKLHVIGAKARHFHPEPQPLFAVLQPAFIDAQRSLAAQAILGDGDIGRHGFEEADVLVAEEIENGR